MNKNLINSIQDILDRHNRRISVLEVKVRNDRKVIYGPTEKEKREWEKESKENEKLAKMSKEAISFVSKKRSNKWLRNR